MEPYLLYPQNAAQAKFFQEYAEKQGVGMVHISQKIWEEIDDMLFAEKMMERDKSTNIITHDELKATFKRLIEEK